VGVEPTHKGFADLLAARATPVESTDLPDTPAIGPNSGQVGPLKGLSLLQPWPWLIFHAEARKDIENRTWPLPHYLKGQRVAIAASGSRDLDECWNALVLLETTPALSAIHLPKIRVARRGRRNVITSWPHDLTVSAIIGTVEIVECVTESFSPWFAGPYGFVLRDPIALPTPIPCKGRLGFWTVPEAIAAEIREQERRAA
jgi:hypothetical protein